MKCHRRCAPSLARVLFFLLGLAAIARGQEAVRMSMASTAAAEARRRAASIADYYNLKLGPTAWRFGTGLGLDYNSNVNYTEDNPEGDFIFRPQVNTWLLWPVSDKNSLSLTLGAGYAAYVKNSGLDRFFMPPSELSFDLYAGDFLINLHDRAYVTEYAYQDPSVAGSGNYSQFQNALGTTGTWDLNKGVLRLGYDHLNYIVVSGNQGQPNGQSEVFSAAAGYALKPGMLLGLELGGSLINYTTTTTNTPYNNANQWNVGGYYDTPVSEYIHLTAHAGYTVYSPEAGGATAASSDFSGMYAQLDIRHRLNQYVEYSLNGGRTLSTTLGGGTVDRYFAYWQVNWRIVRKVWLGTSFRYEHGTDLYANGETYNQYGPQITLSRPITDKLSSSLGYQFYWRTSDLPGRNYALNIVSLNFNYAF